MTPKRRVEDRIFKRGDAGFRAVVGGDHHDGVVQLSRSLKVIQETPDMEIGGLLHACVDLHGPRGDSACSCSERSSQARWSA